MFSFCTAVQVLPERDQKCSTTISHIVINIEMIMTIDVSIFKDDHHDIYDDEIKKLMIPRYAPQNGSATATYFERMAYIEHRFYE